MTIDGFLAFLALIAALYAVAPSVTRLAMRLQSLSAIAVSVAALIVVLYLLLFDTFAQPCALVHASACQLFILDPPRTISANQLAFFVVLGWLGFLVWMLARPRPTANMLPSLAKLTSELADERRYGELLKLLEPYLQLLDRAATRKLGSQVLYDNLRAHHPTKARVEDWIERLDKGEAKNRAADQAKRYLAIVLLPALPDGERAENSAKEVFRRLMRSPPVREYIAQYRPDFGVKLIGTSVYGVHDFCQHYLTDLISNPGSLLYEEVFENQNISTLGYQLPDRNRLLHFLFSDASRAESLAAWQPIGEYALASVRRDMHPEYVRFLNGSAESIERECWSDKVFVSIRFFDIMVQAALFQGINWHMWLYYMSHLTEALVAIHDQSDPNVDADAEWPTRNSYMLYQIFDALADWIKGAEHLKEGEHHLSIEKDNVEHENGNIPKSAALCLGQCLRTLLGAENIPQKFKRYITHMIFRDVSSIPKAGRVGMIRSAAINSIVDGGVLGRKEAYGLVLRDMFDSADYFLRKDLEDFQAVMDRAYPRPS